MSLKRIEKKHKLLFVTMFVVSLLSAVITLLLIVGVDNMPRLFEQGYLPVAVYVAIIVTVVLSITYYMAYIKKR